MSTRRFSVLSAAASVAILFFSQSAQSQLNYDPYFFDGFDISGNSAVLDINFDIDPNSGANPPRQGGIDAPVTWVTNVSKHDPNGTSDYKHQLFGVADPNNPNPQPLQLAEDGTHPNIGPPNGIIPTIVSPDMDFSGTLPNGNIIGKRITFDLDVAAFAPAYDPNSTSGGLAYSWAGITVGGEATLINDVDSEAIFDVAPIRKHFSARFVSDQFSLFKEFMQAYDPNGGPVFEGGGCIGCNLDHNGGDGILSVRIDIDDPNNDGDPWNGVGSTVITVSVFDPNLGDFDVVRNPNNQDPWIYEIPDGGLTSNYISLYGKQQTFIFAGLSTLATHTFDNFTVWSAPAFASTDNADFDGDGVVTGLDFLIYQQNIGLGGQTDNTNGDANGDGVVGAADLAVWEGQYGTSPLGAAVAAVPEPLSICLLGVASLGMLLRRQR